MIDQTRLSRLKLLDIEAKLGLHKLHHKSTLIRKIFSSITSILFLAGAGIIYAFSLYSNEIWRIEIKGIRVQSNCELSRFSKTICTRSFCFLLTFQEKVNYTFWFFSSSFLEDRCHRFAMFGVPDGHTVRRQLGRAECSIQCCH